MGCATSKPDKDESDSIVGDKNSRELPESVYFRNTKYTRSVDAPKVEAPPDPQSPATYAADVCLTDKFDEWKKEQSSAAELFNSCLSVVLPIVKTEVVTHTQSRTKHFYTLHKGRREAEPGGSVSK